MPKKVELKAKDLRWTLDPKRIKFRHTGEVKYGDELLAQSEAVDALSLGLDICAPDTTSSSPEPLAAAGARWSPRWSARSPGASARLPTVSTSTTSTTPTGRS